MQKARQIRRQRSESEDSSDGARESKPPAISQRPVKSVVALSFSNDEEDDENDIKIKKSKASRQFKKMRQAPVVAESVSATKMHVQVDVAAPSFSGGYSNDELANLRKNQYFSLSSVASTASTETIDMRELRPESGEASMDVVIELTGEDAERMEELGDFVPLNRKHIDSEKKKSVSFASSTNSVADRHSTVDDESEDNRLLRLSRLKSKAMDTQLDPNKKVIMSGKLRTGGVSKSMAGQPADLGCDEEDAGGWEEMLARRAGIKYVPAAPEVETTGQAAITNEQGRISSHPSVVAGSLSMKQARSSVQQTVDSIAGSLQSTTSRLKQCQRDVNSLNVEYAALDAKVQHGATMLALMQVC